MTWIHLTCGACGHRADLDEFCSTPIGGQLPDGEYQCPACGRAFRRTVASGTRYESGLYIPGPVMIEEIPTRL